MASQFYDMTTASNFFDVILFLLSSLVTGASFMSISYSRIAAFTVFELLRENQLDEGKGWGRG